MLNIVFYQSLMMANLQEEKDLENNISISARRFEESPFIERHDTSQMVRGVYANRFFAVYNGEDYVKILDRAGRL